MDEPRHPCAVPGCTETITRHLLMCVGHWNKVPNSIRARLMRHYASGQDSELAAIAACLRRRLLTGAQARAARHRALHPRRARNVDTANSGWNAGPGEWNT